MSAVPFELKNWGNGGIRHLKTHSSLISKSFHRTNLECKENSDLGIRGVQTLYVYGEYAKRRTRC
jgi:hypothetical protein